MSFGILDTLYLIYKSNADDVIKGNKALDKSTKETERSLKNTRDTTQEVGTNFVKMAESAAKAIGALSGFEILKSGVQSSIDLNTNLKLNAENLKMTAQQLRVAQEAAKQFGGTAEEGRSDALKMAEANYLVGSAERDPQKMMANLRNRVSGMNDRQKYFFLKSLGLSTAGIRQAGIVQNDEFAAGWKTAADIANGTDAAADKAYDTNKLAQAAKSEQDSFFNRLLVAISTPLDKFLAGLGSILGATGPVTGSAVVVGGSTLAGLGLLKTAKSIAKGLGIAGAGATAASAAEGTVALGAAGALGTGLAIGAGVVGIGYGAYKLYDSYKKAVDNFGARFHKQPLSQAFRNSSGNPDIDFWLSQGYTKEQAAGIVANMQAESGGTAGSVGDGGSAHGLFQWHEKRRRAIINGTGIDINTASHADQLRAAAWEMKNGNTGFNDAHFRSLSNAGDAGAYFATNFEHPANALAKSISRGKNALSIASQLSPATSGGINVKIDRIDIITQATDANAIATGISGALENKIYTALGFLASNVDNGQNR
jgi:hypothetical protein